MKSRTMTHRVFLLNPKKLLFVLLVFSLAFFFLQQKTIRQTKAQGNTHYVPDDFSSIQAAVDAARPGDTIYVKAGTYNERVTISSSGNAVDGYITLRNYPGDKPILDGTGLGNGTMIQGTHISYIKIQGFHIKNHTGAGIVFYGEASHIEIRDNEISDQTYELGHGHAILVAAYTWDEGGPVWHWMTDVTVDGNYIHDVSTGVFADYQYNEALTLCGGISKFQITNNLVDNAEFIGIMLIGKYKGYYYPPEGKYPFDGIVKDNEVENSGTSGADVGIYVDGAKKVVIEHNKVHDNFGNGIVTSSEDSTFTTSHIIVRYNQMWNNARSLSIGTSPSSLEHIKAVHNVMYADQGGKTSIALFYGTDIVIVNNIASNMAGNYAISHYYGTGYPTFDYNCYYPENTLYQYQPGITYSSFSSYQSGTGQDANGVAVDPLFVDPGSKDFHLQANSPCKDAGTFLTTTTNSGTGTIIQVDDASYFSDGYGMVDGDLVQIGSNSPVRITDVNYDTNTIIVDTSISWGAGDGVGYPYSGSAPDIGAFEYVGGVQPQIFLPFVSKKSLP